MESLSPKQKRFVAEYLIDLNATKAAIRAGYSAKTAHSAGPRLLENVGVKAAINEAKAERSKRTGIDADWLLTRLADIADAKLSEIFKPGSHEVLPVEDWPDVWQRGLATVGEVKELFEGLGGDREQIGFVKTLKTADRIRVLELIGKHVQVNAFQDTVQHKGLDGLGDRLERAIKRNE